MKFEKIKVIYKDITTLKVDAIVNAANKSLLGGGGIDGAIHFAAGPRLLEECKLLDGCKTGEAKITKGYNLSAQHIIHTVGPVYGQENGKEENLLRNCYINSLMLAKNNNLKSIAFPCISTGVFRYPKDYAAEIAISSILNFIKKYPNALEEILFVTFSELDYNIYNKLMNDAVVLDSRN